MRACGGISKARISSSPSRPVALSGEYSLSMQNSARCVLPVTSISRLRSMRSTSHGGAPRLPGRLQALHFAKRDLEFVHRIVARFVDARRLAGRADEQAREQIRQRRMVVPVGDHAGEQIGPAQERRIGRRRAAEHEVIAAAGAGVAAVEHEFFGRQARLVRGLVEKRRLLDELVPAARGLDVDFDHARVGRDAQVRRAAGRAAARSLRASPAACMRLRRWLRPPRPVPDSLRARRSAA